MPIWGLRYHWNRNGGPYSLYSAGTIITVPLDQFIQAYSTDTGNSPSNVTTYDNAASTGGGGGGTPGPTPLSPGGGGGGAIV